MRYRMSGQGGAVGPGMCRGVDGLIGLFDEQPQKFSGCCFLAFPATLQAGNFRAGAYLRPGGPALRDAPWQAAEEGDNGHQ